MNWQPIETAPKNGVDVILFYPIGKRGVRIGSYNVRETIINGERISKFEGWSTGNITADAEPRPSHWMPLPINP